MNLIYLRYFIYLRKKNERKIVISFVKEKKKRKNEKKKRQKEKAENS